MNSGKNGKTGSRGKKGVTNFVWENIYLNFVEIFLDTSLN